MNLCVFTVYVLSYSPCIVNWCEFIYTVYFIVGLSLDIGRWDTLIQFIDILDVYIPYLIIDSKILRKWRNFLVDTWANTPSQEVRIITYLKIHKLCIDAPFPFHGNIFSY